jgi:hypothetical protein
MPSPTLHRQLKRRSEVETIRISEHNRDTLPEELAALVAG